VIKIAILIWTVCIIGLLGYSKVDSILK